MLLFALYFKKGFGSATGTMVLSNPWRDSLLKYNFSAGISKNLNDVHPHFFSAIKPPAQAKSLPGEMKSF